MNKTKDKTKDKINSFKDLPIGWYYRVGVPASDIAVTEALSLANLFANEHTDAFPDIEGGIMFKVYGRLDFEFMIECDGSIKLTVEMHSEEIYCETIKTVD